jgi:hypothetical protein
MTGMARIGLLVIALGLLVGAIYGATQRDIAAAAVLGLLAFTAVVFERMIEAAQKDSQG